MPPSLFTGGILRAVVFAKGNSTRVPDKTFREFHDGQSLLDIALLKLSFLHNDKVYISTEAVDKAAHYRDNGYNVLERKRRYTFNHTPIPDVLHDAVQSLPSDDEDVAFIMICNPLLSFAPVFETWNAVRDHGYDSLGCVVVERHHTLDAQYRPIGYDFGRGHVPSQALPPRHRVDFSVSIVKRNDFRLGNSYHTLARPFWYHVDGPTVDIDTMQDFKVAQALYTAGL